MRTCLLGISLVALMLASCSSFDDERFPAEVVTLLERHCASAACHGALEGAASAEHKLDPTRWLTFKIDATGKITDLAGALGSVKAKINSGERYQFSSLLRKTLPIEEGGRYHYRGAVFSGPADADFSVLAAWAATVHDGTESADEAPLSELEQRFARDVYPFLIGRGCATATCHGSLGFGGAVFQSPAIPGTLDLPRADLRATYHEARKSLTFWGDPTRSRLLAKVLPFESGGVPHKGGNDIFFAKDVEAGHDPLASVDAKAILGWLEAERAAELGEGAAAWAQSPPIVFVGGPLPARAMVEVGPFTFTAVGRAYRQTAAVFYRRRYDTYPSEPALRTADKELGPIWTGLGGLRAEWAPRLGRIATLRLGIGGDVLYMRYLDYALLSSRTAGMMSLDATVEF